MFNIDDPITAKSNQGVTDDLEHQMHKSPKDCHNEVRNLFWKLSSWSEDSQREFANIVNPYSNSIRIAINELYGEVCVLQTQLFDVTKERDGLLETVDNLMKREIRELNAKCPIVADLQDAGESSNQDSQEVDSAKVDSENGDVEEHHTSYDDEIADGQNDMNNLAVYELGNVDYIAHVVQEEGLTDEVDETNKEQEETAGIGSSVFISLHSEAKEARYQRDLTTESIMNDHKSQDRNKIQEDVQKVKCEQCSFETNCRIILFRHINEVHDKIRRHFCENCSYSTSHKNNLKQHEKSVHIFGDSMSKYDNPDRKFKCEMCPYISSRKGHMNEHVEGVHKKSKSHKCELCGKGFSREYYVKVHMASIHKIGEQKVKCEQFFIESNYRSILKQHKEPVNNTRDINAKFPIIADFQEAGESSTCNKDSQEVDNLKFEEGKENSENGDAEDQNSSYEEEIADGQDDMNNSPVYELKNVDYIEHVAQGEELTKEVDETNKEQEETVGIGNTVMISLHSEEKEARYLGSLTTESKTNKNKSQNQSKIQDGQYDKPDRKFKCEMCPYASSRKDHMNDHIEGVHKKSKNHKCEICGKGFTRKSYIKEHMASIHKMGEKPHKCELCGKGFSRESYVKVHMASIHN